MARVLLVFEPPDGGVAENVLLLAMGLGAHGHDVEVAAPPAAVILPQLRAAGIPVAEVDLRRGYGSPPADLAALRTLVRLMRRGGYDLVHCHSAKAGALGRAAALIARVPALYSPHCFGFVGDVGAARRAFSTVAEWLLGRLATRVIVCVCDAERGRALDRRLAPPGRVRRVYTGVAPCDDAVEPDAELAAHGASGGPLVGTVTVLRRQKRVDVFLDAVPEILRRVPGVRVAVVGNGELAAELHEQAAQLGLDREERFLFLPFEGPSARYLKSLDVYALTSSWEAMPIGILEALACGVPQVVTDVDGSAEATTTETGVLVPPADQGALADAIVELLGDDARRRRLAEASRARHAERFQTDRMVAETAAIYDEVA